MGEVAGRYELQSPLGSGGGGAVFAGYDRLLDRKVAVKLFSLPLPDNTANTEMLQRFRIGAKAAGRLSHPNIVPVFDYGEDVERAWIVMELVEGASLKALLDRGERYSSQVVLRMMDQILAALEYSHQTGVVHRDVKPANIMITRAGEAKLTDFGVARMQDSSLTMVGSVIGTPAYMAPEQFGGAVDHRADIWAAGAVFYELLTGEKAFAGDDFGTIMRRVLSDDPPPPSRRARLPTAIDAIVVRALAKRPEDRYASAAQFAAALRGLDAANDAPTIVHPQREPRREPRREPPRAGMSRPPPNPHRQSVAAPRKRRVPGLLLALAGGGLVFGGLAVAALLLTNEPPASPTSEPLAKPASPQATSVPSAPPRPQLAEPSPSSGPPQFLLPPDTPAEPPRQPDPPPRPDLRGIAQQAIRAAGCGLLTSTSNDDRLTLNGVLRRGDAARVQQALADAQVPEAATQLNFSLFDADYCGVVQALRPAVDGTAAPPRLTLLSPNPLLAGQNLRFRVDMPDWPAFLHVFYLSTTGEAGNMVQARQTPYPLNARPEFGEPYWRVSEPFGTDLLIAVASSRPLFPVRRRPAERQEEVAAALLATLERAQESGQRISISAVTQQTSNR